MISHRYVRFSAFRGLAGASCSNVDFPALDEKASGHDRAARLRACVDGGELSPHML
jgi:hypothetical protein